MDPELFDTLTRGLATGTSRRQALKTIIISLGGIIGLGAVGTAFGASRCHRNGTGCDTSSQCCSGYCDSGGKCTCPPAPACSDSCPCSSGSCCNGTCTNTLTDRNNCGSCGHTCASGQHCQNGRCVSTCSNGIKDGQETDTDCGGPDCFPCADGKRCLVNSDCISNNCQNGLGLPA
jgi:hypothetical protein